LQGAWYCTAVQGVSPECAAVLSRQVDSLPHQAQSGLCARQSPQLRYSEHVGREGHREGRPDRVVSSVAWEPDRSRHTREDREKPQPEARQGAQPAMDPQ
jgi:hypothetical protein